MASVMSWGVGVEGSLRMSVTAVASCCLVARPLAVRDFLTVAGESSVIGTAVRASSVRMTPRAWAMTSADCGCFVAA